MNKMKNKINKPTSPGRRFLVSQDFSELDRQKPEKSLLKPLTKNGGRNNQGKITVRHRGGGHKRMYRLIDFERKVDGNAEVKSIEYDPNRSAFIALIENDRKEKSYIIAPKGLKKGDQVSSGQKTKISAGSCLQMKHVPTGVPIHNIELTPGNGAAVVRSAGLSATIMAHEENRVLVKLPSGELRRFDDRCMACIGEVSNESHETVVIGKAGRKRWLGIRPTVRGKAMNPNTHPHGGGEAVNSIGLKYPKTPWGSPALGRRTRDRHKNSRMIVHRREKK